MEDNDEVAEGASNDEGILKWAENPVFHQGGNSFGEVVVAEAWFVYDSQAEHLRVVRGV